MHAFNMQFHVSQKCSTLFLDIHFQLFKHFLLLRMIDEGSVPEMRKWSISLIKSDLKWCIHLSRCLFFNFASNFLQVIVCGIHVSKSFIDYNILLLELISFQKLHPVKPGIRQNAPMTSCP